MIVSEMSGVKKKWFPLPNDPDDATFEVTLIPPGTKRAIESRTSKIVGRGGEANMVEIDHPLAGHMRAMAAMTGWDRVFDNPDDKADGRVMKFTSKNKEMLLNTVDGLEEFILQKHLELLEAYEAEREAAQKNSSPSVTG